MNEEPPRARRQQAVYERAVHCGQPHPGIFTRVCMALEDCGTAHRLLVHPTDEELTYEESQ